MGPQIREVRSPTSSITETHAVGPMRPNDAFQPNSISNKMNFTVSCICKWFVWDKSCLFRDSSKGSTSS